MIISDKPLNLLEIISKCFDSESYQNLSGSSQERLENRRNKLRPSGVTYFATLPAYITKSNIGAFSL